MYKWIILMSGLFASLTACAKVKLSPLFSDNMVLQQEAEVPVWGKASPEMRVIVIPSWSGEKYENIADRTGNWKVNIKTPKAGGPYHLEITDGEKVRLENVMIGSMALFRSVEYANASRRMGQSEKLSTRGGTGQLPGYTLDDCE